MASSKEERKGAGTALKTIRKAHQSWTGAASVARVPNENDQEAAPKLTSLYIIEIQLPNYKVSTKMIRDKNMLKILFLTKETLFLNFSLLTGSLHSNISKNMFNTLMLMETIYFN